MASFDSCVFVLPTMNRCFALFYRSKCETTLFRNSKLGNMPKYWTSSETMILGHVRPTVGQIQRTSRFELDILDILELTLNLFVHWDVENCISIIFSNFLVLQKCVALWQKMIN